MKIDLNQFRDAFFEEAVEHLAHMEAGLLKLEETPEDREVINDVFRAAHSIKGASGTFGLDDVTRFTHALEGLLDEMRDGRLAVSKELTEPLLRSTDVLKDLIAAAKLGEPAPPAMEEMLAVLHSAHGRASAAGGAAHAAAAPAAESKADEGVPTKTTYSIVVRPSREFFQSGMDPFLLIRDLRALGEVLEIELDLSQLPPLEALDAESCYMSWSLKLSTEQPRSSIDDVFVFVSDACAVEVQQIDAESAEAAAPNGEQASAEESEAKPHAAAAPAAEGAVAAKHPRGEKKASGSGAESSSLRVSTEKVDELINLVGELVIAQSMVTQLTASFSTEALPRLCEAVNVMQRHTRELQERVMAVRMVPVGSVFSRFPRLVRDLASKFGKQITLEMSGEETELDKTVVEGLGDPLTHLVRNSIDHGIEPVVDRAQAGKNEHGTIHLSAFHEGGSVVVEVADDGGGLNTERIRAKAISQNLIKPEDTLTDDQIHSLIFMPGFSTAQVISDISGRGVGMDVVKRNVEALNGTVAIQSERGKGCRFRLKLPLTLAILDGLMLSVGKQVYIVPLISIVESFRPAGKDLQKILVSGEIVKVRGDALPLIRLHRMFDVQDAQTDPTKGLIVIVETEGRRFGLLVDELLGQSQVVIKNLEEHFHRVDGVMGATILGDGSVALILDVQGMAKCLSARSSAMSSDSASQAASF